MMRGKRMQCDRLFTVIFHHYCFCSPLLKFLSRLFHSVTMSKRSCNTLSIKTKQEIINAVSCGEKKIDVAAKYKIAPSTLTSILKKREFYLDLPSQCKLKRQKLCEYPELERALVKWFQQCRQSNIPVGGALMREKAKVFLDKLRITQFKGSDGWFDRFKKRNNISFHKICGESASVDDNVVSAWHVKLSKLTEDYEPKNVFNADETGLFFKCLPDRTMSFKGEKCHGGKNSKDRITIMLAVNSDGTEKLKPLIIGKSVKPICFKNVKTLPVTYRSNKKAWMTGQLFTEWLQLLNKQMERQQRKILLFIDNCPAHNVKEEFSHVRIQFLPANTTSKLQPLDKGIIQNFKTLYRKEIVSQILESIEEEKTYTITLYSAINIAYKAWQNISRATIKNCYRACGFFEDPNVMIVNSELITTGNWNKIPQNEEHPISFHDYIHFDDDLVTEGILNDEEILELEAADENDDNDQDIPQVTSRSAKSSIENIRNFLIQNETDETDFEVLLKLDNIINKLCFKKLHQTLITDFSST